MASRALSALLAPALIAAGLASAAAEHPARALVERGTASMRSDPEASRREAESALQLLRDAPDADLEIRARLLLCDYHSERDSAAAERELAAALEALPHARRQSLRSGLQACRGDIHEAAGDNTLASTLYAEAVAIAAEAGDEEMLAGALHQRGYLRGLQGQYATALADLRRSQALYEKLAMPDHALTALNGVATLYNRMGDYAQARAIYARALEAQRAAGMRREVAVTQHNLGRAHERLGEWEAARQAFAESLAISSDLGYPRGTAYALRGLAAVANALGDPNAALAQVERANAQIRGIPDARLRAQLALTRGIALHGLGRLPDSAAALESATAVFRHANALGELADSYEMLATVQADLGNWRAAYGYQKLAKATAEKLLRNQLDQRFTAMKIEFDTAATEQENALLVTQNRANEQALEQGRRVRQLQAAVIALTVLLAAVLAWLAIHQNRSTRRMHALAMTDELTGVPNRRAVLGRLEALLARPDATLASILIIDIDHFKKINDQLGHPTGDEVLRAVATKLRAAIAEPAFFGRLGGEEFLIVLPGSDLEEARHAAEHFRARVAAVDTTPWFTDRRRITASIGVAQSRGPEETPSAMLQRADAALYAAKRAGRDCVRTDATASAA